MRMIPFVLAAFLTAAAAISAEDPGPPTLRYDRPTNDFIEALPIGNGRLGAAKLTSRLGRPCRLRTVAPVTGTCNDTTVQVKRLGPSLIEFATRKGKSYTIS